MTHVSIRINENTQQKRLCAVVSNTGMLSSRLERGRDRYKRATSNATVFVEPRVNCTARLDLMRLLELDNRYRGDRNMTLSQWHHFCLMACSLWLMTHSLLLLALTYCFDFCYSDCIIFALLSHGL